MTPGRSPRSGSWSTRCSEAPGGHAAVKRIPSLLAGCLAAALVCSAARAAEWTEDYPEALARARRENKLLLLDFTGSDWCSWCKRIDAEVLATPKFLSFANR